MKVLLHGRLEEVINRCIDRFNRLKVEVDVARTLLKDGIKMMRTNTYDKVFVGPGVSLDDRLHLIKLAGEIRGSIIELQDRNTIYKELKVHSLSGEFRLPIR